MLVGRQRELAAVQAMLDRRASVAIVGEAGVGKTALLGALTAVARERVFVGGGLAALAWQEYPALEQALGEQVLAGDRASVARFAADRLAGRRLVLDDLQWAGAGTLDLLPSLVESGPVVVAIRHGDAGAAAALDAVEASGATLFELEPLDDESARVLLQQRRPSLAEESVRRILASAHGVPLLLEELSGDGEPSPGLALSLRARVGRASATVLAALATLGLLGRPAGRELLTGEEREELLASGMARSDGELVVPRHALLGEIAADELDEDARRVVHLRIAEAAHDPGEAARHFLAAGHLERAREHALISASLARFPGEQAADLAVAAAATAPGEEADALRIRAARAYTDAGSFAEARAVAAVVTSRSPLVRAEALLEQARAAWRSGDREETVRCLERGLRRARNSETSVEIRLLCELSTVFLYTGRARRGLTSARRAASLADETASDRAQAYAALAAAVYWSGSSDAIPYYWKAYAEARRERNAEIELFALGGVAAVSQVKLEPAVSRRALRRAISRARGLSWRSWELQLRWWLAQVTYYSLGRYPEAIADLRLCCAEASLNRTDPDHVVADLATALADTGELSAAERVLSEGRAPGRDEWGRGNLIYARAEIDWLRGRPEAVLRAVEEYQRTVDEPYLDHQMHALGGYAAWELGLPRLAPGSRAHPHRIADLWRRERLALARLDEPDGAEQLFLDTAAAWAGNGIRYQARCLWAAGEAAALAGSTTRARTTLLRAERLAQRHGLVPMTARIQRSLRRLGTRRAAPRLSGQAGLTRREEQVLALVGEGYASGEIAARLGIARSTVDAHVKSSMQKLGTNTRRQAALVTAGINR